MQRFTIDPKRVHPFETCPVCGDDIQIHEWMDVVAEKGVVDCDRNDPQLYRWYWSDGRIEYLPMPTPEEFGTFSSPMSYSYPHEFGDEIPRLIALVRVP